MSNDLQDDEALFAGFDSLVPPRAAALHAVDQARRLLLQPIKSPEPSRMRAFARYGLAAAMLLVAVLGVHLMVIRNPGDQALVMNDSPQQHGSQEPIAGGDLDDPDGAPRFKRNGVLQKAMWVVPHMHAISAERAPVTLANGGKEPIRLGSTTRERGGLLHVWDWSKSLVSRVLPDVEFWGTENVALSPDGNQLVWARGDILNLQTGVKSRVDLGGEFVEVEEGPFSRIGDMQFSPDGGRLAILVSNLEREKDVPGARIKSEVVQVVEFPTGRRLCEFPAGESYALRIGFSADGRRIASADTGRQVLLRDAATGDILQRYRPALTSQVMGVAISPDGKHVAATQREPGDLFTWEVDSGRLTHRIDGGDLRKHGGYSPSYGAIRFSPDSQYLAAELGRLVVFDVNTGEDVVTLSVFTPTNIQWSDDGERVTVVSPVLAGSDWTSGDGTTGGREDQYPEVTTWEWRNKRQIPTFEEEAR